MEAPESLPALKSLWQEPPIGDIDSSTPAYLRKLVSRCWSFDDTSRPTFADVTSSIHGNRYRRKAFGPQAISGSDTIKAGSGGKHVISKKALTTGTVVVRHRPLLSRLVGPRRSTRRRSSTSGSSVTPIALDDEVYQSQDKETKLPTTKPSTLADELSLKSLGCWQRCWYRAGLHFASPQLEQDFSAAHLHNDEYYRGAKWLFLFLSVAYLVYGISLLSVYQVTPTELAGITLRSGLLPVMYCVLFLLASIPAWCRATRKYTDHLVWGVLAAEIVAFVLVPALTPEDWLSINRQVSTIDGGAETYYAPDNATFVNGNLVG